MDLTPIFIREEIIKEIRAFFYKRKFHEVIVPTLNDSVPLEANLHPFSTVWNRGSAKRTFYLSMSPERGLKRMLAAGIGNCFALGKSFRNLENNGSQHIPEFLMLEWYREKADYTTIMQDLKELILTIELSMRKNKKTFHCPALWETFSLTDLFFRYAKIDLEEMIFDDRLFFATAKRKGYEIKNATWASLYDQIFVNEIEANLPEKPFFLVDFPSRVSALCKPKNDKPYLAERFEFYMKGKEIANGNSENTDSKSVGQAFQKLKSKQDKGAQPIDEEFLSALDKMDGTLYAGVGLGVDRLAMIFSGVSSITDVEPLLM